MFSLLFPSCCVTNHIFHPGACWCRAADCSSHHSTSWLLQPGPRSSKPAWGSLAAILAHRLPTHPSRCCVLRENSPFENDYRVLFTIKFLLGVFFFFSRKKDRETLEDFHVDLHYRSAKSAETGCDSDSLAQTHNTPRRSGSILSGGLQSSGALLCSCRHHVVRVGTAPGIRQVWWGLVFPSILPSFLPSSLPPSSRFLLPIFLSTILTL